MKIDQYSLKYTATGPPKKTGTKMNVFGEMDQVGVSSDRKRAACGYGPSWAIHLQIQSLFLPDMIVYQRVTFSKHMSNEKTWLFSL